MSSLTEEQKKKIEESRRKALAIKAAKAQQKPTLEKNVPPVKPGTPSAIAKAVFKKRPDLPSWLGTKSNGNAPRVQSTGGAQNSKILGDSSQSLSASYINGRGRGTSKYGATNHSKSPNKRQHDTKPLNDDVASTSHSPLKSSLASKLTKVKGRCVLTSREQFMVDIGYSAPLVALFKTMQTKQYGKRYGQFLAKCISFNLLMSKATGCFYFHSKYVIFQLYLYGTNWVVCMSFSFLTVLIYLSYS